jgi:hypothetical protein
VYWIWSFVSWLASLTTNCQRKKWWHFVTWTFVSFYGLLLATSQEVTYMFHKFIDFTYYFKPKYLFILCWYCFLFVWNISPKRIILLLLLLNCSKLEVPSVVHSSNVCWYCSWQQVLWKISRLYHTVSSYLNIHSYRVCNTDVTDVWKCNSLNKGCRSTCIVLTWSRRNCFIRTQ